MTIARDQVADLQPGDIVDYRRNEWPEGAYVRSPLTATENPIGDALYVLDGQFGVRTPFGDPYDVDAALTLISRAPRPLYVNHPHTEPVAGDVARDADSDGPETFIRDRDNDWCDSTGHFTVDDAELPPRLRLLVDGETGQVVSPQSGAHA